MKNTVALPDIKDAHRAYAQGEYEKAYDIYSALAPQVEDPKVWMYAAHSAMHIGRYDQAQSALEQAVALDADPALMGELAKMCSINNDFGALKAVLAKAEKWEQLHAVSDQIKREQFGEHYYQWRQKRLAALIKRYGADWFNGKRIVELGCGYGDLGMQLVALGAEVHFVEGREEHLKVMRERYPDYPVERLYQADLNSQWPVEGEFDMVIHFGLLYHLKDWQRSIKWAKCAKHMVLETEVCDMAQASVLAVEEDVSSYDQALTGAGSRPSGVGVEDELGEGGWDFEILADSSCNSGPHVYDWEVDNTGGHGPQYRRLWFCSRK